MKQIGGFMAVLGIAAIIFGFMDRVPKLLMWIYNWGDGAAWAIKIALIAAGGALYFMGNKKDANTTNTNSGDAS